MGESQIKFEMNPLNRQKSEGQVQATKNPIPTALFLLFMETERSQRKEGAGVDRRLPPSLACRPPARLERFLTVERESLYALWISSFLWALGSWIFVNLCLQNSTYGECISNGTVGCPCFFGGRSVGRQLYCIDLLAAWALFRRIQKERIPFPGD